MRSPLVLRVIPYGDGIALRVRPKMRLYETDTLYESPPDPLRLIGDGHFWSGQRFVTFLNPGADGRMRHVASRLRLHKRSVRERQLILSTGHAAHLARY